MAAPAPTPTPFRLFDLPAELRMIIFKYAVGVQFIQYKNRRPPPSVDIGTYNNYNQLYYVNWHMSQLPRFEISDPGARPRFYPLATLLPLMRVCRQIYSEAGTTFTDINDFYVSLQDLPRFLEIVPDKVIHRVKTFGILNNMQMNVNWDKFGELRKFMALKKVVIVARGGPRDRGYKDTVESSIRAEVPARTVIEWE